MFKAFEVGAFNYIVKPFGKKRITEVIKRAIEQADEVRYIEKALTEKEDEKHSAHVITVRSGGSNRKVILSEIVYAEIFDRRIILHMKDRDNVDYNGRISELESISGEISSFLDQYEDKMPDNYFLDVSTVGAERPIRNEKELMEALGEYIYVKTKDKEYYGTFTSYNNGVMNLKVKEKTREKDVSVNYQDTKKVRYAVKF